MGSSKQDISQAIGLNRVHFENRGYVRPRSGNAFAHPASGPLPDYGFQTGRGLDVVQLCDRYHALNRRRAELDQRIMALAEGDDEPDVLWKELGVVLAEGNTLVTQLATAPADDRAGLQAKAAVLAFLLRSFETAAIHSEQEMVDLTLSVTDDIARLTW